MSQQYDDTNRGALFKNDKGDNPKKPDYTGKINVEGKDFYLSAWIKEGRNGKFMSLSVQEPKPKQEAQKPYPSPRGGGASSWDDLDDSIPF